jgi:hypothetical protein
LDVAGSVKGVITIVARGPSARAAGADSASAHAQAACAASAARSAPLLTHATAEAGQSVPIQAKAQVRELASVGEVAVEGGRAHPGAPELSAIETAVWNPGRHRASDQRAAEDVARDGGPVHHEVRGGGVEALT